MWSAHLRRKSEYEAVVTFNFIHLFIHAINFIQYIRYRRSWSNMHLLQPLSGPTGGANCRQIIKFALLCSHIPNEPNFRELSWNICSFCVYLRWYRGGFVKVTVCSFAFHFCGFLTGDSRNFGPRASISVSLKSIICSYPCFHDKISSSHL